MKFTDKIKDSLSLHVSGATVKHTGSFSDLTVIENSEPLSNEFLKKYVVPFYMSRKVTEEFRKAYLKLESTKAYLKLESTKDIELVSKLLGDFNWRSRSVGAYFAALETMKELEINIGNLLLRSDVCYAGHNYCLALASFSTETSIQFLHQYLEYYLEKPDLRFDQNSAMAALSYIGNQQGKDLVTCHMQAWETFIIDKPNWDLENHTIGFVEQMESIIELKSIISS